MTFIPGFAYIPGIHWTVTCRCLLLSVVPTHAPDPLAVDPGPPVSCTAPLPQVTSTQHTMAVFRHLARQGLRILPSSMDGHCLLHSVWSSWKSQVSQLKPIDLETIKMNSFTETANNADKYFGPFNYNSFALFQGLRLYLIQRNYKSMFGELVPHIIANALCVNLNIINEKLRDFEYIPIVPRDGADGAVASLTLHRQGEHYNGVGTVLITTVTVPMEASEMPDLSESSDKSVHTAYAVNDTVVKYDRQQLLQIEWTTLRI